ncbi:Uncharacterized protein ChrSV_0579 [Chromobacterium vaccinii]|nr:Uncharacterized protein ChrSW_0579 [Chromobacterium vaccinii]QND88038.1 Uncharacterized protein ChrSV_0579 [Chromobacterium vaccinii]
MTDSKKEVSDLIYKFNALSSSEKLEKFNQMNTRPPRFLYKYFPSPFGFQNTIERIEWLKAVLIGSKIHLSSRNDFNDPFDVSPRFIDTANDTEMASAISRSQARLQKWNVSPLKLAMKYIEFKSQREELLNSIKLGIDEQLAKIGIFCLSEANQNILMWSHYASNHTGLCVKFDMSADLSLIGLIKKVEYTPGNERPTLEAVKSRGIPEILAALSSKSKDWEYEKEWRVLKVDAAYEKIDVHHTSICEVVLGAKSSEELFQLIIDINKERQESGLDMLNVSSAALSDTHYEIICR